VSVASKRLPSGAAHDAMVLGRITDFAMIFVRSVDGRSHSPEEYTSVDDLAAEAAVLAAALARLTARNRSPTEAPRRA
jgi:allantoate deiminase